MEQLSKYVFYPLWDIKDRSGRLRELARLEKQQWWPREKLEKLQWERLEHLLSYAAENSLFYRQILQNIGVASTAGMMIEQFRQIPITTKREIRNNLEDFVSRQFDKENLIRAKTGGSTGVSLNLFFDERCQQKRNAAQMMGDRWAGWDLGMKTASIWGNPPVARTFKQKVRQQLMDRAFYLDTMEMDERSMMEFVARWRGQKPGAVFGHAHSIYVLSKFLLAESIHDLRPRAIVATSMMLLDHERKIIEQAFNCPVTNRYGCEEVGLIACECERHNGMHINMSHVYVEVLDEHGNPVKDGEPGKIVLTDLNNYAMPLIRYRVEDVGVVSKRQCACGRGFPILERLEGRIADFLKLPQGGLVAGVSLVERTLTKVSGIEQMQLVQGRLHELLVKRVRGKEFSDQTDGQLIQELREVFGESVKLIIEDVDAIPQEPSGKYRFSICRA